MHFDLRCKAHTYSRRTIPRGPVFNHFYFIPGHSWKKPSKVFGLLFTLLKRRGALILGAAAGEKELFFIGCNSVFTVTKEGVRAFAALRGSEGPVKNRATFLQMTNPSIILCRLSCTYQRAMWYHNTPTKGLFRASSNAWCMSTSLLSLSCWL